MGSMLSAAFFLLALAVSAPSAASKDEGRVVDQIVAVVRFPNEGGTSPVTLSRLVEEARIAMISRGAVAAASRPLDGAALRASLEWLIGQIVLDDEVTRLGLPPVAQADIESELSRFRARFAKPADFQEFLDRLDITTEELTAVLRRMLRVQRYVESRVRHAAPADDSEVEAFYQEHRAEFGGRSLASVRQLVRARMLEERIRADVKSLVGELRERCEIRMLADLDALAGGT
jgi:hypothetical protein